MKKHIIALCLCAMALAGCDFSETPPRETINIENGKHFRLSQDNYWRYNRFSYINVDGHEYLVYVAPRQLGLTHSPNCKCIEEKLRTIIQEKRR